MNLRVYNTKDKLRETIDAMSCVRSKEELNRLFADAIQELLEYELELKKEIGCEKLNCTQSKEILNSIYGVRNMK